MSKELKQHTAFEKAYLEIADYIRRAREKVVRSVKSQLRCNIFFHIGVFFLHFVSTQSSRSIKI